MRLERFGPAASSSAASVECVNVLDDPRYHDTWMGYYQLARRKVSRAALAQSEIRTRTTLIGAMLIRNGGADAMLCGTVGPYVDHLRYREHRDRPARGRAYIWGFAVADPAGSGPCLYAIPTWNSDPSAEQVAELTMLAAEAVRKFGIAPQRGAGVALGLRQFGPARGREDARGAGNLVRARNPDFPGGWRDAGRQRAVADRSCKARCPDSPLKSEKRTCW